MQVEGVPIEKFISDNINSTINDIAKKLAYLEVDKRSFIIQQITGRQKIRKKLPSFYRQLNLIIPPSLNLEQSSSEETAKFKASLFSGKKIIDITGGFGIDAFALAQKNSLTYCEIDPELAQIAQINARHLSLSNFEALATDGVQHLSSKKECYDVVYLDPARRNEHNKKLVRFEDCTPNILEIKDLLFDKAPHILMKTSPMFDLSLGIEQLKNVTNVWIVAVRNEVKEMLWLLEKNTFLDINDIPIHAVNLKKEALEKLEANRKEEQDQVARYGNVSNFLYEPNASVLKAGFFNLVSTRLKIQKLAKNSHLYTSEKLISGFPGRSFEVLDIVPYKTKLLKKRLEKKKINISTRNFPSLVGDLISKFKIVEGGEEFVFFTQQNNNDKIVIFTKKVNS
jgi:hypothetical protein